MKNKLTHVYLYASHVEFWRTSRQREYPANNRNHDRIMRALNNNQDQVRLVTQNNTLSVYWF